MSSPVPPPVQACARGRPYYIPHTHPVLAPLPAAEDFFWDDLLEYIEARRVIPIVGSELLTVPDGCGGEAKRRPDAICLDGCRRRLTTASPKRTRWNLSPRCSQSRSGPACCWTN